jgi:hypothetical protein
VDDQNSDAKKPSMPGKVAAFVRGGPGRCERGVRGHNRDRAFREKGAIRYAPSGCRRNEKFVTSRRRLFVHFTLTGSGFICRRSPSAACFWLCPGPLPSGFGSRARTSRKLAAASRL